MALEIWNIVIESVWKDKKNIYPTLLKFDKSSFVNMVCGSHTGHSRQTGCQPVPASPLVTETKRMLWGSLTADTQQWQRQWINVLPSAYFLHQKRTEGSC